VKQLQALWAENSIKATMIRTCLSELEPILDTPLDQQPGSLVCFGNTKRGSYVPLLQMLTCPSLEEKLGSSAGKRRRLYLDPSAEPIDDE